MNKVKARSTQLPGKHVPHVKNIIAVASGKGGVGKSTAAVNLACAIKSTGANVGLLDADIYGPNQPKMLGATTRPQVTPEKKFHPLVCHGLQTMSIGYLIDENTPMIWRGPMVSRALEQLVFDTLWQDLDYLIIDLPPGTGDIQLTLAKKIPLAGVVMITTPQDIALMDVKKGIQMFNKVNVHQLGIIENMATHTCSNCGHDEAIFGSDGASTLSQQFELPLLAQIPLDINIRKAADNGTPIVISQPEHAAAKSYQTAAAQIIENLALQKIDYTVHFSNIKVEKE